MEEKLNEFIQCGSSDIKKILKSYVGDVTLTLKDKKGNITQEYINQEDIKDYKYARKVISMYCLKSIIITDNEIFQRYTKLLSIYGKPAIIRNKDLTGLFKNSIIVDGNLNKWIMTGVTNMNHMFYSSKWNKPLDNWDTSKVTNMCNMFAASEFNHPLNGWNTSKVTNMGNMFMISQYNHPLNNWDVSRVTRMNFMFFKSKFNHPLDIWDVSKVVNMDIMFYGSKFNHSIDDWDVSGVIEVDPTFYESFMRYMK